MENERKGFEIFNERISADNVMRMAELLAASALKLVCRHRELYRMRANLARDIDYKHSEGYIFTDGYDLVQEAALFLCGYMGQSAYDTCIDPKSGRTYQIRRLCSKVLCHKLYEEWKIQRYVESTEDLSRREEPFCDFQQPKETDYAKYDTLMEKLHLNRGEKETIEGYMAGIGFTEQAKMFSVNISTIWRRRKSAQMKYLAIADTL